MVFDGRGLVYIPNPNFECTNQPISKYLIYSTNNVSPTTTKSKHGHPWMRYTTSTMVGHMYASLEGAIVDVGSKYHSISPISKHLKVLALRPKIHEYDRKYIIKNPPDMYAARNFAISHTYFEDNIHHNATYVAVDCLYYLAP
jgi:hypothetical protein